MRRILLASIAATLVLAGCGGSDGKDGAGLSAIKVTGGKTPKVTFDKGFEVSKTESKVLKEGGGDEVKEGDSIKLDYVGVNGTTAKLFDSTYAASPQTVALSNDTILAGFVKGLEGRKVGSRVLVAIPPTDGFGDNGQPSFEIDKADTMVLVFDIRSKVPTEVTGDAKALPSSLPKLKLDGDKHPSGFTSTGKTEKKQAKASAHTVITGEGPKVKADQTVTVQYVGQVYPDGKVFDTSWTKGVPFTQSLSGLIKCWQTELTGQTVGSRVVLVCPPDTAYAGTESELKDDTLIFAIDLLDAS
ncbi:FKBP-type peptidyl-prolyl cis-trans isomerase [Aeromicrobium chenweiae]|uniref:FKBP-type peptidyl-prolyl cis-trans isomerase n=1 Tax=Aeromicrobium chenweiae TaxID=2079793 RepID=UPI00131EDBCC|nr:FKBP-type peptidyl-prolyl cis-trans isomerase [Aeromicrobium chenweiae]